MVSSKKLLPCRMNMEKKKTQPDREIPSRGEIEQKLKKLSAKIDQKYREFSGTVKRTKTIGSLVRKTINDLTSMTVPMLKQAQRDMEIRILLKQKIQMDIEILQKKRGENQKTER